MFTKFPGFFALALLLAALFGSGLALRAFPADSSTTKSKTPPARGFTAAQDKQMEDAIRRQASKSKIGEGRSSKVHVQGGVAYWEGTTDVVQHKGSATRMAKTAGAIKVVNNIKVGDAAKQAAAGNLDQGRRRAQVKRSDASDSSPRSEPRSQRTRLWRPRNDSE